MKRLLSVLTLCLLPLAVHANAADDLQTDLERLRSSFDRLQAIIGEPDG